MTSTTALTHYDATLPITLACDASSIGIGEVIYHVYPDGKEKPIAYASKTLPNTEQKYLQIKTEALSIILKLRNLILFFMEENFYL